MLWPQHFSFWPCLRRGWVDLCFIYKAGRKPVLSICVYIWATVSVLIFQKKLIILPWNAKCWIILERGVADFELGWEWNVVLIMMDGARARGRLGRENQKLWSSSTPPNHLLHCKCLCVTDGSSYSSTTSYQACFIPIRALLHARHVPHEIQTTHHIHRSSTRLNITSLLD